MNQELIREMLNEYGDDGIKERNEAMAIFLKMEKTNIPLCWKSTYEADHPAMELPTGVPFTELHFHLSWDWLMVVLNEIYHEQKYVNGTGIYELFDMWAIRGFENAYDRASNYCLEKNKST